MEVTPVCYSERCKTALEKAVDILLRSGVRDEIEAYKLLVKHESELGYPVTYEFVLEALRRLDEQLLRATVVHTAKARVEA